MAKPFLVHPGAVWLLVTCQADTLPVVTAVDVEGYRRSEAALSVEATSDDGLRCRRGREYFEYEHVGVTPGGTHVLDTWESGGGSGIFRQLLFVRLERERMRDRDRMVLRCTGEFGLGDRDDGSVELRGNRVVVSASRYRREPIVLVLDR